MKQIFFSLLMSAWTYINAQTMDTVRIGYKTQKFNANKHILMGVQTFDTSEALGKKIAITRYYYFDKKNRMIKTVLEYDQPKKPKRGTQLIYYYNENQLAKVTVIPPKSACSKCASEYYYSRDTLISKKEYVYINNDLEFFLRQAHIFKSQFPDHLPWGYFGDEIIVNGKMKKTKRSY